MLWKGDFVENLNMIIVKHDLLSEKKYEFIQIFGGPAYYLDWMWLTSYNLCETFNFLYVSESAEVSAVREQSAFNM